MNNIENIDNVDNSVSKENYESANINENYISLYKQSEMQSVDDNIHNTNNIESRENNDPVRTDENYMSLYTQSEQDIDDTNEIVLKSNSMTLGEVRQAMNNGLLDEILPMGGPVYKVNSSKDTNNIDLEDNNVVESNETQVKTHFINTN